MWRDYILVLHKIDGGTFKIPGPGRGRAASSWFHTLILALSLQHSTVAPSCYSNNVCKCKQRPNEIDCGCGNKIWHKNKKIISDITRYSTLNIWRLSNKQLLHRRSERQIKRLVGRVTHIQHNEHASWGSKLVLASVFWHWSCFISFSSIIHIPFFSVVSKICFEELIF